MIKLKQDLLGPCQGISKKMFWAQKYNKFRTKIQEQLMRKIWEILVPFSLGSQSLKFKMLYYIHAVNL